MKRLLLSLTVLLVLAAPLRAQAGDCRRLSISQCEWGASVEASAEGMTLAAETNAGLIKLVFHAQGGTLRVEGVPGSDGRTTTVKVSFRSGRKHSEAVLDVAAAGGNDFSSLLQIAGNVDSTFLATAEALLDSLPKEDVAAMTVANLGHAVTSALRTTSGPIHPQIAGVAYAACYWGCVAGSGGWQECGDYCYAKYKWN